MTTARLLGLHHSPWTERARWALDHHRIPYDFEEYAPVIGEIRLRFALRAFGGKVTVPVFFASDIVLRDSLEIVRHADATGASSPLVPSELEADVLAWNARAETAFQAGRSMYVRALLDDPDALAELAPRAIPGPLRGVAARAGTALFKRKHRLLGRSVEHDEAGMVTALDALRAALRGDYVLGRFSLADIAMAISLQHVSPVSDEYIQLTPPARSCSTQARLADRYADVVAWRDALYARHRRPAVAPPSAQVAEAGPTAER